MINKFTVIIAILFLIALTSCAAYNARQEEGVQDNRFTAGPVRQSATFIAGPTAKKQDPIRDLLSIVDDNQRHGEFDAAKKLIAGYMAKNKALLSQTEIKLLNDEIERNRRIPLDYKLDESQLFAELSKSIKGFGKNEFVKWQKEGRFDIKTVNGQKRFMNSSKSNLFFRYPELNARRIDYNNNINFANEVYNTIIKIKTTKAGSDGVVRAPYKMQISHSLTLNKGLVNKGAKLSCWIPFPIAFESQNNIKLIRSSYPVKSIDSEKSPIRSAFFEITTSNDNPGPFEVEYSYTSYSNYRKVDPLKVGKYNVNSDVYKKYTREEPHITFSNKITRQVDKIIGSETNPYIKAKKIYNWICDNIKYSYCVEYSTLRNISEYTLEKGYGDCGQQAMLFISMCRSEGIPARWQSGLAAYNTRQFIHDWAETYIEPYGWIPVDTYMGVYFTSVSKVLGSKKSNEIRDFYFGNMDYFRMVANKGHSIELKPDKKYLRSDAVDFQRGEIESGRNFYFDEWKYKFKVIK
ncbi:MAG TPA: transglutaminase domain-containing protein [Pseudobacteroides sp.]|uniref:transglutaminase-like domain-containing protein n=1 Tax=Pseudobacteroides sp. TaxID=1968840 RepID=UPI002F95FA75